MNYRIIPELYVFQRMVLSCISKRETKLYGTFAQYTALLFYFPAKTSCVFQTKHSPTLKYKFYCLVNSTYLTMTALTNLRLKEKEHLEFFWHQSSLRNIPNRSLFLEISNWNFNLRFPINIFTLQTCSPDTADLIRMCRVSLSLKISSF
jgi:hypothetical protein